MSALTVKALRAIAVEAKHLEAVRETISPQPSIKRAAVPLPFVSGPVIVNMVNRQETNRRFSAALAFAAVMGDYLLPKCIAFRFSILRYYHRSDWRVLQQSSGNSRHSERFSLIWSHRIHSAFASVGLVLSSFCGLINVLSHREIVS